MGAFCGIVVVGIVVYLVFMVFSSYGEATEMQKHKIIELRQEFKDSKEGFYSTLGEFFKYEVRNYERTISSLSEYISQMELINRKIMLESPSQGDDNSSKINECYLLLAEFKNFSENVLQQPCTHRTRMMDSNNYGMINRGYFDSVQNMSKIAVDTIINQCDNNIYSNNFEKIFAIDVEMLLRCVWFCALEKPYSAEAFRKSVQIFQRIIKSKNIDVYIAELYALKQVGGEDILKEQIQKRLKDTHNSVEELTLIASALKWINAYQVEYTVLKYMLSNGMQMSAKTQERLHSLANGGDNVPSEFDVSSNIEFLYFDVSSLTWKTDEYIGLFENLAFQEKVLSYSLAIRDEDKDLFITNGINVPPMSKILKKLNAVFADEYGNVVSATIKKCVVLAGNIEEQMEGILVESKECKQMGILVHIARIGKKMNIKFYTLFMPGRMGLVDQKQQVLSLYNKLSPSAAMWESSMKDTSLMAIQQLLNAVTQESNRENTDAFNVEVPIF